MVIDTSALAAILFKEPDRQRFLDLIGDDSIRLISSVTALEAAMVVEARKGEPGGRELDLLLHKAEIEIVTFTADHFEMARHAWRRFGKGNHRAALNFCDCCAYALSKMSSEPLLFKGMDFSRTDVVRV